MFDKLDASLKAILEDRSLQTVMQPLYDAETRFLTPGEGYVPDGETINLFLYETRENRVLRDVVPKIETVNGLSVRRLPPIRVDCAYLVTAWSKKTIGDDRIAAEHKLLAQAFNWLSRFPVIPDRFLQAGGLSGQVFDPPTLVAQMDAVKNVGEFWSALGIPPRPFFNLIVTITMDLDQAIEEFPVTTVLSEYKQPSGGDESLAIIGGTVRDRDGNSVPEAWVRLEPPGLTQVSDAAGRFIFTNVTRGSGFALRARASGFANDAELSAVEIPSLSGNYDLQFPN